MPGEGERSAPVQPGHQWKAGSLQKWSLRGCTATGLQVRYGTELLPLCWRCVSKMCCNYSLENCVFLMGKKGSSLDWFPEIRERLRQRLGLCGSCQAAETPGSDLRDALPVSSSTEPALGARAPLLPSACQAGRWAPAASRLAASSAACHTGCCRAGIAKLLHSSPAAPPGWQEPPAPRCPPARLPCPNPREPWPKAVVPWRGAQQLGPPGPPRLPGWQLYSRMAASAGSPISEIPSVALSAWWLLALSLFSMPPRQGRCCPLPEEPPREGAWGGGLGGSAALCQAPDGCPVSSRALPSPWLGAWPPHSSSGCMRVLRAPPPAVPLGSSSRDRPGLRLLEEINGSLSTHTLAPESTGAESLPGNYIQEHKQVIEKLCWQKHQDLISA